MRFAEIAAEMGIELFVMDDGWFQGRRDDTSGLGDWWPDAIKFPNGLGGLIERVNQLGMDFDLDRAGDGQPGQRALPPASGLGHPFPDAPAHGEPPPAHSEHGETEVQEYIIDRIDRLLSDNNIAYVKWT